MTLLVAGRLVQGLGAGSLIPIGLVIVYELFPAGRRGTALGVWGVGMAASPAAGPPLGGWIVTVASWRWIFGIFFVVAAVAIILTIWLLTDSGHRERRRLDGVGWLLGAAGLLLVVVAARMGPDWGLMSPEMLLSGGSAALVLTVLVRRSLGRAEPIIEFRVFSTPTFSIAMLVVSLASFAQYARLTFLPIELQVVRGFDAGEVGLILGPAAIGVAITMPIGGWLADRVGSRLPVLIGLR